MFGALLSKLTDYHGDFFRNINRPRAPREVFADLAQEARDALVAEAAEATTRKEGIAAAIAGPFDYAAAITYPFVPVNWHASRFSDVLNYGVWYGSIELETTVYETAYHWHRFVMDAYASEDRVIRGDRQVFKVRCDALLIDLREKAKSYRWITHRSDTAALSGSVRTSCGRVREACSRNRRAQMEATARFSAAKCCRRRAMSVI
jgi:hypothetical protein